MPHDFTYDRDELGRVRIVAVKPDYPLSNPFEKLSGSARNEILFWPLTRAERQMVRGSRHLPLEERRVVAHHILSLRAEKYRDHQAYLAREAKRLRDQDVIDDENRRAANWNSHLAREAEIRAEAERNRPPPPPLASGAKPETYATKDATWEKDEEDEIEM